uniref:Uncharacterized protein n=1 Tax=Anguilla anguilla TaxID=7936 RepID=A0A0E9W584_ANGAN
MFTFISLVHWIR